MNEFEEALKKYLMTKAAEILKCDETEVFWEDDIDEYGFASMEVNQLCVDLNDFFAIDTQPALFLEITSLEVLSQYLKQKYFSSIENKLL